MKLLNKHDDDAEITWRAARAAYALAGATIFGRQLVNKSRI